MNIEAEILLFIQNNLRNPFLDQLMHLISSLGDLGLIWIIICIVFLLKPQTRPLGIYGLLALIIGALLCNALLKPLIGRVRPYQVIDGLLPLLPPLNDASFPSGHTTAAFAAAFAWRKLPPKWTIIIFSLAILMAFSRLYLGVHYPSDILGGIALGLIAAMLSHFIGQKILAGKLGLNMLK